MLYVSRSALEPQGNILGEIYFEQHLEREGFTVFRPEEFRFTSQMDHYRKAKIVIFPEGSACHGTELMGTNMMGRTFIVPRRRGQMHIFQRVVEPRSACFKAIDGCVEYLGTASADRRNGTPLSHIGVSWIDIESTVAFFRSHGLALLRTISEKDYAEAAEIDFQRYLTFQARPGAAWNEEYAADLKATFAQKMLKR